MTPAGSPHSIELRLQTLDQLFDPFDPFPLPTRDLARSAEDYIVGWALELPADAQLGLRVYLTDAASDLNLHGLRAAIAGHFNYRARRTNADMRELIAIARRSLAIGFCVLAVCVAARQLLRDMLPEGALTGFLAEGLVIVGWVANWRPIDILLYEWWPLARRRRLFQRLAAAPVEVQLSGARPAS